MSSKSPGTGSLGTHELSKLQFPKKQKQKKYSKPIRPIGMVLINRNVIEVKCYSGLSKDVHSRLLIFILIEWPI